MWKFAWLLPANKDGLVRRTGAGFCQEAMPNTGAIWLSPAGVGKEIVITAPIPQTMHLYLPTALFDRLKDIFRLPVARPIRSVMLRIGDDVIDQIGRSILSELTVETAASRVYVEAASLALAAESFKSIAIAGHARPPSPPRIVSIIFGSPRFSTISQQTSRMT